MSAYAASVVLRDQEGNEEDIELSRYRPGDPGVLVLVIVNEDDGTAFEITIKDEIAKTSEPRPATKRELAFAKGLRSAKLLLRGVRPASQTEQFLYTWAYDEDPPPPR